MLISVCPHSHNLLSYYVHLIKGQMFHLAGIIVYICIMPINSLLKMLCIIFSEKDQVALVMYMKLSNTKSDLSIKLSFIVC